MAPASNPNPLIFGVVTREAPTGKTLFRKPVDPPKLAAHTKPVEAAAKPLFDRAAKSKMKATPSAAVSPKGGRSTSPLTMENFLKLATQVLEHSTADSLLEDSILNELVKNLPRALRPSPASTDGLSMVISILKCCQQQAGCFCAEAETELRISKHGIEFEDSWLGYGLLMASKGLPSFPEGYVTQEIEELCSSLKSDEPDRNVEEELSKLQVEVLQGSISLADAVEVYQHMRDFARRFQTAEPKAKDLRDLLSKDLPSPWASLLNLSPASRYRVIKAHGWKADISELITFAVLVFHAHMEHVQTMMQAHMDQLGSGAVED